MVPDPKTERTIDSQATWVICGLGVLFCHVIHEDVYYNQELVGVQSTGAGIKCLDCEDHSVSIQKSTRQRFAKHKLQCNIGH